jgi:cellulose synthase operon protein C
LRNCEKPEERFATMQKATMVLPRTDLDQLLAAERTIDGEPEFEPIRGEIAPRAIPEADADPKIVVAPADLALVEKLATVGRQQADHLLSAGTICAVKTQAQRKTGSERRAPSKMTRFPLRAWRWH